MTGKFRSVWRTELCDALNCRFISSFKSSIGGLVQDCINSSALAMELLQSCAKPLIYVPWNVNVINQGTFVSDPQATTHYMNMVPVL